MDENFVPRDEAENHMLRVVKYLDTLSQEKSIVQTIELEGECPDCGCPRHGHLDEARLKIVPGSLTRIFTAKQRFAYLFGRDFKHRVNTVQRIGVYPMKQAIVKSGLFTEQQLKGCRFNQHELELNAQAFRDVRPFKCECNLDLTSRMKVRWLISSQGLIPVETSLVIGDTGSGSLPAPGDGGFPTAVPSSVRKNDPSREEREKGVLTAAEVRFIAGENIRTGFRKRSEAARIRRADARRSRAVREVIPVAHPVSCGTGLASVNPDACLKLVFKFKGVLRPLVRGKPGNKRDRLRSLLRSRSDLISCTSRYMSKKDGYFLRKTGAYYISVHGPLGPSRVKSRHVRVRSYRSLNPV